MKITKIEKKKRLYLLEFDEKDRLYVTEDTIVHFFLSKNMEISSEELEEIKRFAQLSYGKNLALYQISFKPRTKKEVHDYLLKHEIDQAIIPEILGQLQSEKWIDDARYADTFIDQQTRTGDKGPYVLKQKLIQKGIAPSLIDEALADADFNSVLNKVTEKLIRQYQAKLPLKALKDKVSQSLINKGFSYQDAKNALAELDLEKDEENELDLIERDLDKLHRKYSRKYDGYDLKQRLTQALMRKGYDYSDIKSALREYL